MTRIFVSPTAEPSGLYDGNAPRFAVHLAPDMRTKNTAQDAESFVEGFLANARDVRFYKASYTDNGSFDAPVELKREAPVPDDVFDPMAWLRDRAPKPEDAKTPEEHDTRLTSYWRGPDFAVGDGGKDDVTILTDTSIVSAMDLLRGSLNWPAPLPQRAGLVHLVTHPKTDTDYRSDVIFPWWDAGEPPTPTATWHGVPEGEDQMPPAIAEKERDRAILLRVGENQFITRLLKPFPEIEGYGDDGWITPGWADTDTVRQLRRARTAFSGSLSPLLAISNLSFAPDPATGKPTEPERTFANWLDQHGATMLLDPFDVAVFGTDKDGRLWDTLVEVYEDVAAKMGLALQAPAVWELDKSAFKVSELRKIIDPPIDAEIVADDAAPEDEHEVQAKLPTVLLHLNEIATELADANTLLDVTMAYLKACLTRWDAPLAGTETTGAVAAAAFASKVEAALRAHYTGTGADLAVDLREDSADFLMTRLQAHLDKQDVPEGGVKNLETALQEHDWIRRRIALPDPVTEEDYYAAFRPLEAIPSELEPHLYAEDEPFGVLFTAKQLAIKKILPEDFTPDLEPQPLQIVAAQGFDADGLDEIGAHTTGIGLIIAARHATDAAGDFLLTASHANASAIFPFQAGDTSEIKPVIEPSTLTRNYGQIEISMPYNGIPQIGRLVADRDPNTPAEGFSVPLPYTLDHADYGPDFRPLVPLAYGYEYAALPFYVSNYGTLPAGVSDATDRLRPVTPEQIPQDRAPNLYLRTTAVATVPVSDHNPLTQRRLGYVPEDVYPIAPDLLDVTSQIPPSEKPKDPALLLLGHAGEDWLPAIKGDVVLDFTVPRVGYEDFDRWMTNTRLRDDVGAASGLREDEIREIFENLSDARDFLEGFGDRTKAEIVNRLPDPAVRQLEVRVQVFDALLDAPPTFDQIQTVAVEPYADLDGADWATLNTYRDYEDLIKAINGNLQYTLTLRSVQDLQDRSFVLEGNGTGLTLKLRDGDICLVTVSPLVKKAHYQTGPDQSVETLIAIHKGLIPDGDANDLGEFYRLQGTPVLVEAMKLPERGPLVSVGDLPSDPPVLNALRVKTKGRDRGFSYELCPEFDSPAEPQGIYRAFAEVDLITHRWRSLGQPIYNWIAPTDIGTGDSESPVRVLPNSPKVANFEDDAFFGRQLFDGERQRLRLPAFQPGNAKKNIMMLDQVSWPDQSACYWRYTQLFRSRYLGALRSQDAVVPVIGEPGNNAAESRIADLFANRVAILADISSGTLAAPQLRHILPSLATTDAGTGPLPLVASLNERPFDQYGLADRILAGVTTTRKFKLNGDDDRRIEFTDYRKEAGSDPRRSQRAIEQNASRKVMLRAEGPLGHHFDPASADAPGFVNTSYLLHLEGTEEGLETSQMFTAVELRRLVDPGWSFAPPRAPGTPLPATWWLDLNEYGTECGHGLELLHERPQEAAGAQDAADAQGESFAAVTFTPDGDWLVVSVDKDAAYGDETGAAPRQPAELCRVNLRRKRAVLVDRSLGDDGFEIVILQHDIGKDSDGNALSAAQFVAASNYRAGPFVDARIGQTGTSRRSAIAPMLIGGPPAAIWAQSAYDMARFCVGDAVATLDGVVAHLDGTQLQFRTTDNRDCRLTSRDATKHHPLSVHTHLAALTLDRSPNAGRTMLMPVEAVLLDPIGRGTLSNGSDVAMTSLLAFESPAEVLELRKNANKASATFDLDAVTGDADKDVLLRCRVSKMPADHDTAMTLTLSALPNALASDGQTEIARFDLEPDELADLSYIDIRLPVGGGQMSVTVYERDAAGVARRISFPPPLGTVAPFFRELTLNVSGIVAVEPGNPDIFAALDISMIPAVPREDSAWNWDWVFPPVAVDAPAADAADDPLPPDLDAAIRAENLRRQTEAVATPLGMTEPITLLRDT